MRVDAVVLAAGTGSRMKAGYNKVFLKLQGKEILLHTLEAFERSAQIDGIIVVTGAEDIDRCLSLAKNISKLKKVIPGGSERQESSYIGVLASDSEYVMIHDGARALITTGDIDAVASEIKKSGAAAVGFPCVDTMKRCSNGKIIDTIDRDNLFKVYTPQGFERKTILKLHADAKQSNVSATDDCALYEWGGKSVSMITGDPHNIKITTPEDICIAEAILSIRNKQN